jgi:subtilisin family serine protease
MKAKSMSETNTKRITVNNVLPTLDAPVDHYGLCNIPFTGKGVKICLIDSGVTDHEAILTLGDDINLSKSDDSRDRTGHSTIVSGIIAGNKPEQIIGFAPNSLILNAKAVDDNCIVRFDAIVASILWGIIQDVNIIAIPITTDIDAPPCRAAIEKAIKAGITVIAAAGNSGKVEYPAAYDGVISVGALTKNDNLAHFSGTGRINVAGTNVQSTYVEQCYCVASGTSVSTAIVVGICSRIIEKLQLTQKSYTQSDVFKELQSAVSHI